MPSMGVVRAEGVPTASVLTNDKFVIQRFDTNIAQYTPFEATIGEVSTFVGTKLLAGNVVKAVGTATLVGGTATVALPAIIAGDIVLLTVQLLGTVLAPQAQLATVTGGVGFVITSAGGTDTSHVGYTVIGL